MLERQVVEEVYKKREQEFEELLNINPVLMRPIVTQNDARQGYITRYFIRPVNDPTMIVEIDKIQYENLKANVRFITTSIKWKIVGVKETKMFSTGVNMYGVRDLNKIEVANADIKFGGLKIYINDYLEFWFSE